MASTKSKKKIRKARNPFITTIRGTKTIIYDRKGKPVQVIQMRRYKKPLIYRETNLKKNPDKITFMKYSTGFVRMEIFAYQNNPEKVFISLNNEVMGANKHIWRLIQSGIMKSGKFLDVLK